MNRRELRGKKFGRLRVLDSTDERYKRQIIWKCECDCGNITYVPTGSLTRVNGGTRSCGCIAVEKCSIVGKLYGHIGRKKKKQ